MKRVGLAFLFVLVMVSLSFAKDPYGNRTDFVPPEYRLVSVSPILQFDIPMDDVRALYLPSAGFNYWTVITKSKEIIIIPGEIKFKFHFQPK